MDIKISDFGLSASLASLTFSSKESIYGTVPYAAPEFLNPSRKKERGVKGDVFSFGVIAWELFTRAVPWQKEGFTAMDISVSVTLEGRRLEIPESCVLKDLIKEMWKDGLFQKRTWKFII